ncbi:MAG: hypothetical protein WKF66_10195 [Pedobacter sp.]
MEDIVLAQARLAAQTDIICRKASMKVSSAKRLFKGGNNDKVPIYFGWVAADSFSKLR